MRGDRLLVRLFPRAWRERYGDELLQLLDEGEAGAGVRPYVDLVQSGLAERMRQFQRLVWSGVRHARGRAVALGAGMMVASVSFSLLTATVEVGTAHVDGDVGANWRGAYDLLVLPAHGGLTAPSRQHLVEANYLSADGGGITIAQYEQVSKLPGVGVAAPLAVVGYLLETAFIPIDLTTAAGARGPAVLTLESSFVADNGLSKYPPQPDGYVYVTPDHLSPVELGHYIGPVERLPDGRHVTVCPASADEPSPSSPFRQLGLLSGSCESRQGAAATPLVGYVAWSFPVLVAGIDPTAESELTGLGRAVISGRYLAEGERVRTVRQSGVVPVLASSVSFDGDLDHVTVGRLASAAVAVARSGWSPTRIARALATERTVATTRTTVSGQQAWESLVRELARPLTVHGGVEDSAFAQNVADYWSVGGLTYTQQQGGVLAPRPVRNPSSVWASSLHVIGQSYVIAPPAAEDVGFRSLSEHTSDGQGDDDLLLLEVGKYDPYRLAGFGASGPGSPLASYRAPVLTGANAASRALLGGRPLEPDGNIAGYAQQPPLLLTTLAGVEALEDPTTFSGTSGYTAPIGSIRVRVSGLRGSVPEQLGKIAAIGQEITRSTGLRVVVTAGSSPQQVPIALPPGDFGRPALRLSEPWTATMVALVVLRQADRESVALFILIIVVCGLFLAGAALAGVRGRREEIGVLRALGWGRWAVFSLVLGEVALLGVGAGVVGAVLSVALIEGLALSLPISRAALVLPVALALALLAGLAPAAIAARTEPMRAIAPAARAPRRKGWPVRSIRGLALTGVARVPGRCALAAAALAAGVAGLAVLLAAQASFDSSIGDSALAGVVTASTRGTDVVSAILAVGLGAAAVADVTYLNLRERAAELAALAASGWTRLHLARLLATEALLVAVAGSLLGAGAGLLAGGEAFGVSWAVLAGIAAAAAIGTGASLLGTVAVLAFTSRRQLAVVLAAEE